MADAKSEDAALMRKIARAEPRACRFVVDSHLRGVHALACRMLNDPAMAEDIAQESFARLWKQAPKWRADATIKTWLYRVAHNLAIDVLRKQGRETLSDHPPEQPITVTPAHGRHQDELARLVNQAIAQLPERQRTALALVHFDELSGKQAAAIMGVSIDALDGLLTRARASLKHTLKSLHPDLEGDAA